MIEHESDSFISRFVLPSRSVLQYSKCIWVAIHIVISNVKCNWKWNFCWRFVILIWYKAPDCVFISEVLQDWNPLQNKTKKEQLGKEINFIYLNNVILFKTADTTSSGFLTIYK